MSSIPQRLYNEVMMADDFTCVYCGVRTPAVGIDHVIPRSQSGPDVLHNLVACCPPCNARKSDHQLQQVGMQLQYGRFGRSVSKPYRRRIKIETVNTRKPMVIEIHSPEQRALSLQVLADERRPSGDYLYSANQLMKMVGGTRKDVLDQVRAIRNLPQFSDLSAEQQAFRERLGLPKR